MAHRETTFFSHRFCRIIVTNSAPVCCDETDCSLWLSHSLSIRALQLGQASVLLDLEVDLVAVCILYLDVQLFGAVLYNKHLRTL